MRYLVVGERCVTIWSVLDPLTKCCAGTRSDASLTLTTEWMSLRRAGGKGYDRKKVNHAERTNAPSPLGSHRYGTAGLLWVKDLPNLMIRPSLKNSNLLHQGPDGGGNDSRAPKAQDEAEVDHEARTGPRRRQQDRPRRANSSALVRKAIRNSGGRR